MKLPKHSMHILDDGSIDSFTEFYKNQPNDKIGFNSFYKRYSRGGSLASLSRPIQRRHNSLATLKRKGKWNRRFFDLHPDLAQEEAQLYVVRLTDIFCNQNPSKSYYKVGVTTDWNRRVRELKCISEKVLTVEGSLAQVFEIEQACLVSFRKYRSRDCSNSGIDGLREEVFKLSEDGFATLTKFIGRQLDELKADSSGRLSRTK